MAKYTTTFKLKVVQFYLSGQGGQKRTAHAFGVNHSDVRKWVSMYQKHGESGLVRKIHFPRYTRYTFDFK